MAFLNVTALLIGWGVLIIAAAVGLFILVGTVDEIIRYVARGSRSTKDKK